MYQLQILDISHTASDCYLADSRLLIFQTLENMFDTGQSGISSIGQIGLGSRDLRYLESEVRSRYLDFQPDGLLYGQVRLYTELHPEILISKLCVHHRDSTLI